MKNAAHLEAFFTLLEAHHPEKVPLTAELREHLSEIVQERSYRKFHILLHEEQVPHYAWFILEGAARVYYYSENHYQEETCWFWYPGQLMFSLRTSFRQLQAGESVQLLCNSKLLAIPIYDLVTLTNRFPEYRLIERALIEDYQCRINDYNRIIKIETSERFLKLLPEHKAIFNLTQHRNIASFMKMHPNTLSRLKTLHL